MCSMKSSLWMRSTDPSGSGIGVDLDDMRDAGQGPSLIAQQDPLAAEGEGEGAGEGEDDADL